MRLRRAALFLAVPLVVVGAGLGFAAAAPNGQPSESATGDRIENCLEARGFSVSIGDLDPIVMTDREVAAEYGYGVSLPMKSSLSVAPSDVGDEFGAALGECATEERPDSPSRALQDAHGRLAPVITEADIEAAGDFDRFVLGLPGVADALESWQTCIQAAGYSFENPGAARASIEQRFDGLPRDDGSPELDEIQQEERALATADVACRESALFPALMESIDAFVAQR
jgi:hypothetical protein